MKRRNNRADAAGEEFPEAPVSINLKEPEAMELPGQVQSQKEFGNEGKCIACSCLAEGEEKWQQFCAECWKQLPHSIQHELAKAYQESPEGDRFKKAMRSADLFLCSVPCAKCGKAGISDELLGNGSSSSDIQITEQGKLSDPVEPLQNEDSLEIIPPDPFEAIAELSRGIEEGIALVMKAMGQQQWHEYREWCERMEQFKMAAEQASADLQAIQ